MSLLRTKKKKKKMPMAQFLPLFLKTPHGFHLFETMYFVQLLHNF